MEWRYNSMQSHLTTDRITRYALSDNRTGIRTQDPTSMKTLLLYKL